MRVSSGAIDLSTFRQIMANHHLGVYFSQSGEDIILSNIFKNQRNGFYVDIGCNHPIKFSNTFLLHYASGWSGLNVDADPDIIHAFKKARPEDICVHAAVSDIVSDVTLRIFKGSVYNTIDEKTKLRNEQKYKSKEVLAIEREVRMTTRTLENILSEHFPQGKSIDLLSIDVEGVDVKVLRSNDWSRFPARVVCIEDHEFSVTPGNTHIRDYMHSIGYKLYSHVIQTSVYVK